MTPLNPPDPNLDYQLSGPPGEAPSPKAPFQARRFLVFLLKYWWVPAFTAVLGVGVAIEYLRLAPSTFVSYASMWETEKLRLPDGALFTGDSQNYLGTQIELLRSGALSQLVIQRLLASGPNAIPKDQDGRMVPVRVSISQVPKCSRLAWEAESTDGGFARAYLNTLLHEYLDFKKNLRKSLSDNTLESMQNQAQGLEAQLNDEQGKLTAFERTNNLAILQEEGNVSGTHLATLETQLSDAQLEYKLLQENEGRPQKAVTNGVDTNATPPAAVLASAAGFSGAEGVEHRTAAKEIEMRKLELAKLSKIYRPKHPKIVKLQSEIALAEKLNELYGAQNQMQLEDSRKALLKRIEGLRQAVQEWEVKVMKASDGIAEADRLKLNVNRIQVVYDRLRNSLQNIDMNRSIDQETLAILQPATPAGRSLKKEKQTAAAAVLAGLAAGLGIILIIAWRDDRFTSLLEVSEKFGDVILGQVPQLPRSGRQKSTALLQVDDVREMYAESYRNLRSALLFMSVSLKRPKTLLITSAMPHEGKSTIASNLARTLALGGSRVVLIDADVRRGQLHELLGMKREPGLTDLLQHPEELDKVLQTNCTPNLSFIARGWSVSRPGDLFVGPTFALVLAQLRQKFEFVVIDTSPVFAADDVASRAPRVDGTLFVVRSGVSRAGPVAEALEVLSRRQANILGVVVNGADSDSKSYHYYKDAEYYQPLARDTKKLPA